MIDMINLEQLILAIILVESSTEIIIHWYILDFIRKWIKGKSQIVFEVVSCGYCISIFFGLMYAYIFKFNLGLGWPGYILGGLILQRLANILNDAIDRFLFHINPASKEDFFAAQDAFTEEEENGE